MIRTVEAILGYVRSRIDQHDMEEVRAQRHGLIGPWSKDRDGLRTEAVFCKDGMRAALGMLIARQIGCLAVYDLDDPDLLEFTGSVSSLTLATEAMEYATKSWNHKTTRPRLLRAAAPVLRPSLPSYALPVRTARTAEVTSAHRVANLYPSLVVQRPPSASLAPVLRQRDPDLGLWLGGWIGSDDYYLSGDFMSGLA